MTVLLILALAIAIGLFVLVARSKKTEAPAEPGKCPSCGSDKICVYKRGYSILLGLASAVVLTLAFYVYMIVSSGYSELNEDAQNGFVIGLVAQTIWPVLVGLLCGFIGSGKLKAKCLSCGHKFFV